MPKKLKPEEESITGRVLELPAFPLHHNLAKWQTK